MLRFSPKIEIINHFDNLINKIDIDIETGLQKYNDEKLLSELLRSSENYRKEFSTDFYRFKLNFMDSSKEKLDLWPESTKVVDYLKQVRMKTIDELRKAQEDTIEYYKLNSARFKSSELTIDRLISELFADKYYFQVDFKQSEEKRLWPLNNFIFATDFYLPPSYIDSLEKLINGEKDPFGRDPVFDDKTVLTGLLYKSFSLNLVNVPNLVIHVRKQDIVNIRSIDFFHNTCSVDITSSPTFDLSKLVELSINLTARNSSESLKFNIEGLVSLEKLHLGATAEKVEFSIKNLPSLTKFHLSISGAIDESIVTRLFDQVPHIEELGIDGNLSSFNLDNLVYLRKLSLIGTLNENFNFELFKNLCNQLEHINIFFSRIDWKTFVKLFESYQFPYLVKFYARLYNIWRFDIKFFNRFRSLRDLNLSTCNIEVIEHNSFYGLANLESLDLNSCQIREIEKNAFSTLKNLKKVDLSFNKLKNVDPKFIGLRESAEYCIANYPFRI